MSTYVYSQWWQGISCGAGPGNPNLLTKQAERLIRADIILYDRLVNPLILQYAEKAVFVNVGKSHTINTFNKYRLIINDCCGTQINMLLD